MVDPELRRRIKAVRRYLADRPGVVGIVLQDRESGARWCNEHATTSFWACSTPKLAMVVDLLLRQDAGAVDLSEQDRGWMRAMLHSSDNDAADALWDRHGAADFLTRFADYGMPDAHFTDDRPHTWGWIRCTPTDLDGLVRYVLDDLPAGHRRYVVREMRGVHENQQWGVWGAGAAARPGLKNGWSDDDPGGAWVMNSVGFAGPDERYTLSVMNSTGLVDDGYAVGMYTTTRVATLLLG